MIKNKGWISVIQPLFFSKEKDSLKMQDEKNIPWKNKFINLLVNYEPISHEDSEEFTKKYLPTITNEHDKEILKTYWFTLALRNNKVKQEEKTPIQLKTNETLYYYTNSISLYHIKTTSRTIVGNGFKTNSNGFRSFVGNVRAYDNEEMTMIESIGVLYITNQRIIFITPQKQSYVIPMKQVLEYAFEGNSVILTVENKEPYKFTVNNNFYYYEDPGMIVDSAYDIMKAIDFVKNQAE